MTGRYPFANGVRDNGSFRFDGSHPTLAGTLKQAGYSTAAFVGAFVLDGRFGLNAGFDLYDDRMRGSGSNLDVVQRTAEQVLAPATDWILQHDHRQPSADKPAPWFGWIHLYDPHEPYTPPEPFRTRYAGDPYAGEIAYTDAVLGQFLERLRSSGALDHTLVIITSDHGESLGEHGERTHGLFAYDVTLRVPLILWSKGALPPAVSRSPSRLVDLMPTVLDLVGVPVPAALDGRSLRAVPDRAVPADDPGTYFEALNANLTRGWAPLKGMVHGRWKVIDLPIPELYDVTADAGETSNLYASKRAEARDVEARLDRAKAGAASPAPATVDAAAAARLRSLGYVVGSAPKPSRAYTAADDPKRLAHLNAALDDAVDIWSRGDGARAVETPPSRHSREAGPDRRIRPARVHAARVGTDRRRRRRTRWRRSRRPCRSAAAAVARIGAAGCRRSPAIGGRARAAGARGCVGFAVERCARPDLCEDGTRTAGGSDVQAGARRRRRTPQRRGTISARCI